MQEKAQKVSTTIGLHQQDAEKMNAVIKTMTGEAEEYEVGHGHYLSLSPVTNMDGVDLHFYSKSVRSWGNHLTSETMDELRETLKKSRRWTYRLIKRDE